MFTSTVVTVALGTIAAGFRASLGTAQWACRRFGTTRVWLVCVGLFAVFSALCAAAAAAAGAILLAVFVVTALTTTPGARHQPGVGAQRANFPRDAALRHAATDRRILRDVRPDRGRRRAARRRSRVRAEMSTKD
ncbi:hypothetical protein [Amycolatopsis japonica]